MGGQGCRPTKGSTPAQVRRGSYAIGWSRMLQGGRPARQPPEARMHPAVATANTTSAAVAELHAPHSGRQRAGGAPIQRLTPWHQYRQRSMLAVPPSPPTPPTSPRTRPSEGHHEFAAAALLAYAASVGQRRPAAQVPRQSLPRHHRPLTTGWVGQPRHAGEWLHETERGRGGSGRTSCADLPGGCSQNDTTTAVPQRSQRLTDTRPRVGDRGWWGGGGGEVVGPAKGGNDHDGRQMGPVDGEPTTTRAGRCP